MDVYILSETPQLDRLPKSSSGERLRRPRRTTKICTNPSISGLPGASLTCEFTAICQHCSNAAVTLALHSISWSSVASEVHASIHQEPALHFLSEEKVSLTLSIAPWTVSLVLSLACIEEPMDVTSTNTSLSKFHRSPAYYGSSICWKWMHLTRGLLRLSSTSY